jgi:hypothetical protein
MRRQLNKSRPLASAAPDQEKTKQKKTPAKYETHEESPNLPNGGCADDHGRRDHSERRYGPYGTARLAPADSRGRYEL